MTGPTLPEGSIETCSISCIQYIDADGDMGYAVRWEGNVTLSTTIGLLELAKVKVIAGQ